MPAPDTKYVLALAQTIEDTKATIESATAHLKALQAEWDSLFASSGTPKAVATPRPRGGRRVSGEGVAGKVLATFEATPERTWDAELIAHHLGIEYHQARKAISNLYAAKKIQRLDRGKYAANAYRPSDHSPTLALSAVN